MTTIKGTTINKIHMKKIATTLVVLAVLFGLAQFIRPDLSDPPVTQDAQVPDSVKMILRKGCYDCHSNETALRWFDKITPANFLVAGHIRDARKALNFSHWDSLKTGAQRAVLFWSANDVRNKVMPLGSYLAVHGSARLDDHDLAVLENYLSALTLPLPTPAATVIPYRQLEDVKPEWNGIEFIQGFEKWKVVGITERFDNSSLRVIYANAVAVKAIHDHQINPWPDGSVLAKAAYKQQVDSVGGITMGSFIQVEFMIKDSKQYASTLGWGFGRWRGADLKPYGADASFTGECVSCHTPLKSSDYTFTYPIPHAEAEPQSAQVIGESVNVNDRTMSIMYADSSVATWSQRADPRWVGARIPDALISFRSGRK